MGHDSRHSVATSVRTGCAARAPVLDRVVMFGLLGETEHFTEESTSLRDRRATRHRYVVPAQAHCCPE
jgi:hypothetical protein